MSKVVGLVPMRHESERVPGKNYRDFHGRPLYHHIVEALLESGRIDEVVINTDSPLITEDAQRFPKTRVIQRPAELLGGDVPMNDVLRYDVSQVTDGDLFLQTHSTNPLLKPSTIATAVDRFLEVQGEYDSLFSVTALQTRLYWPDGRAINHDPNVLLRTQDLPPVYEENSCLYLFTRDVIERTGRRIGDRPLLHPIEAQEATDIDVELDFRIAEALFAELRR